MYDKYVEPLLPVLSPYLPYVVALLFLWGFIKLFGGHIGHIVRAIFEEVLAVIQARPTLPAINLIGTVLLFLLVLLLMFDGTLEFLYGKTPTPAEHALFERALKAFCGLMFGVFFLISIRLAR